MRDVAAKCGCSQPTVSLCLNNSPLIPAATRERVHAIALRLGYRKHPLVAAHMRSRRQRSRSGGGPVLALVNPQLTVDGWRKNSTTVQRQMLAGAIARAGERGYTPQEFWLHRDGMSPARFSAILRARGITGLLIGPGGSLELDLAFDWDAFCCVQLGSARLHPPLHRVVNDHYQSAMLAVRECHALGYRRPGLVLQSSLSASHDYRWEAGYQIACQQHRDLAPVPTLLLDAIDDRAGILRWFKQHQPDVVIESGERVVLRHLASTGHAVPKTVGVVSLAAPRLRGPTSGTVQDGHVMGANAIDLLISLVERNDTGLPARPITQMTSSVWNAGATVRQMRPAAHG